MSGAWGTPSWMAPGPQVGETFVQGKTKATARALLDAAKELGIPSHEVRTVTGGFIVPNTVWDRASQLLTADTEQF